MNEETKNELQQIQQNLIAPKNQRNDFAKFKNRLTSKCTGDYIFQIDADEIPAEQLINVLLAIKIFECPGVESSAPATIPSAQSSKVFPFMITLLIANAVPEILTAVILAFLK